MLVPAFLWARSRNCCSYVIFTDTLTLAAVASTLFVLRRRRTGEGGYAIRGYPLLPALYLACLIGVAVRVLSLEPRLAAAGMAILLTGWPLFRLGRGLFGAQDVDRRAG